MATLGFPRGSVVENLPAKARDMGSIPGVGKIPWRRAWLPVPVFLPGESHGQRSLAGCSLWGSQRVRHDWAVMHVVTSLSLLSSSEITWPVPSLFEVIMGKSHSPNNPFTENLLSVGQCTMWKAQNKETLQAVTSSWVGERHFNEEHDFTLRKPKEQRGYFSFGGISGEQHFGREGQSSDLQASRGGHLGAASDLHVLIMLSAELFFFSTVYIPDGLGGMKTPPLSPSTWVL